MKTTTFLNRNTTSILSTQAASFHAAVAQVKAARAPRYQRPGSSLLAPYIPLLKHAVDSKLTDKETVKAFNLIPNNPLAGLSESTAIQYVSNARIEFGMRKYF